jgi:hypothetical protein
VKHRFTTSVAPSVESLDAPTARTIEAAVGIEHVSILQEHLRRLRSVYQHPNRTLHYDTILTTLLMGFFNSAVRSLRTLEDQSRCESFNRDLPVDRVCRSTLSDALAQMDPKHLLPIIQSLMKRVPALRRQDDDLHALLRTIIAADGSVFTVPADVLWAIALKRSNGQPGRQIRLNLQLDVLKFLPTDLSVSGGDDGSESAAFMRDLAAGVIYVADRNFVDFKFIHAVFDKGSDLVVRLKLDTKFIATEEKAITDADRAANVVSDRIGYVPGSSGSPGFGDRLLREVVLIDPRSGKPVRLLTSLLEVPARIIGLIYRHRWMIELFFKWLKCVARVRHLFSQSQNGITTEFYVAVIAVLLSYLRTGGRRPSLYAFNCLGYVAAGLMSVQTMLDILRQRERERELERARLARKRAAAAKAAK